MADEKNVVKKTNSKSGKNQKNGGQVKVEHVVVKPDTSTVGAEAHPAVHAASPVVPSSPTVVKTGFNTLALISFISSLLFFLPLHWLVGVITGHIALKQLKQNPAQEGDWAARSGLIISYVFLGLTVSFIIFIVGLGLLGVLIASMF